MLQKENVLVRILTVFLSTVNQDLESWGLFFAEGTSSQELPAGKKKKFKIQIPLQPHQEYILHHTVWITFSELTWTKDDHITNSHYLTCTFFKRLGVTAEGIHVRDESQLFVLDKKETTVFQSVCLICNEMVRFLLQLPHRHFPNTCPRPQYHHHALVITIIIIVSHPHDHDHRRRLRYHHHRRRRCRHYHRHTITLVGALPKFGKPPQRKTFISTFFVPSKNKLCGTTISTGVFRLASLGPHSNTGEMRVLSGPSGSCRRSGPSSCTTLQKSLCLTPGGMVPWGTLMTKSESLPRNCPPLLLKISSASSTNRRPKYGEQCISWNRRSEGRINRMVNFYTFWNLETV